MLERDENGGNPNRSARVTAVDPADCAQETCQATIHVEWIETTNRTPAEPGTAMPPEPTPGAERRQPAGGTA